MRPCRDITSSSKSPTTWSPSRAACCAIFSATARTWKAGRLYAQQMMSDEGFLNNSVELRLTLYKQLLRAIANAILDIRLQTMGMTEQEAWT